MPDEPYLSLIVPAYNEAATIARTLGAMRNYLDTVAADDRARSWEIIVSADGQDGTRERARGFAGGDSRISVIGAPERRGKGKGVREGILQARGQIVGFVDADYKTPIDEIVKILPALDEGYPVVIGSRRVGDFKIVRPQKLYRRIGSKVFAAGMRAVVGLYGIHDTQCGFKFFTREAARRIFSMQRIDGYMFDVEILRLARKLGYRIKEVGVLWQDDGDSRLNLVAGNLKNALDILSIRFMKYPPAGREDSSAALHAPTASPALSLSHSSGRGPGA
jgi:glycosyltransferase involved in cell wall biosynthesis